MTLQETIIDQLGVKPSIDPEEEISIDETAEDTTEDTAEAEETEDTAKIEE